MNRILHITKYKINSVQIPSNKNVLNDAFNIQDLCLEITFRTENG